MKTEDIANLPKVFIVNVVAENVDAAWDKMPEYYKNDYDIFMCVRCRSCDT